jgi:hypothetical protein
MDNQEVRPPGSPISRLLWLLNSLLPALLVFMTAIIVAMALNPLPPAARLAFDGSPDAKPPLLVERPVLHHGGQSRDGPTARSSSREDEEGG